MAKIEWLKSGVALAALLSVPALTASVVSVVPARAADTVIAAGETETDEIELEDDDTLTVEDGGTLTVDDDGQAVKLKGKATGVAIDNAGLIENTDKEERAIDTSGGSSNRQYSITNRAGGIIRSEGDAIRLDTDITEGGVALDNAGLITSTKSGQALDFASIESGDVTVTITNQASGEIKAADADGIRPGENATVTNFGLIEADSLGDGGNDGVDLREASMSHVINKTGGAIRGAHQGVNGGEDGKGTVLVTNEEGASIIGRNGSGVGSDNTGKVINYGTIQGNYDPTLGVNGDGDGVDIDFYAEIDNWGLIEGTGAGGVDSGGQPNNAEGVPIGGGVVNNYEGGRITGQARGMLVDDGSGGSAHYATQVTNFGQIDGQSGYGIKLVGEFDDTIVNGGLISGANGQAVLMGDGDDRFVHLDGGSVEGYVDAEDGMDTFELGGADIETATEAVGVPSFDLGLIGSEAIYRNFETFLVTGEWNLTGSSAFGGAFTVEEGLSSFNGDMPNANVTMTGGRAQGTGTVGSFDLQGGTLAPGNSIGTLTVVGDYVQGSAGTLEIETDAAGNADALDIGGTASLDGALNVIAETGDYALVTEYQIISADGGIAGDFDGVTVNLVNLDGAFAANGTIGTLTLSRNDVTLQSLAATPNQEAFAAAAAAGGAGSEPYDTLVAETPGEIQTSYAYATGEQYASQMGALYDHLSNLSYDVGRQMSLAGGEGEGAMGLWGFGTGSWANYGETEGLAGMHASMSGFLMGGDYAPLPGFKVGLMGGYQGGTVDVDGRRSSSDVKAWQIGGYASQGLLQDDLVIVSLSGFYGEAEFETDRYTVFGGAGSTARADYDADYGHAALTALYRGAFVGSDLPLTWTPYAGIAWTGIDTGSFTETGAGAGNLTTDGVRYDAWSGYAGVRLAATYKLGGQALVPFVDVGLRHIFTDTAPTAEFRLESGAPFAIEGLGLDRDAAEVKAGADYSVTDNLSLGLSYEGRFASETVNQQMGLLARYRF